MNKQSLQRTTEQNKMKNKNNFVESSGFVFLLWGLKTHPRKKMYNTQKNKNELFMRFTDMFACQ